ncbi:hypothetical protein METBIDRAFT_86941 [Metschnikowia bicuspidata var. bicuspidata NRRL YB-4993]|uniref:Fork-head domain-containing protein n=1 Tax=Metschnikowia bicuspidata var. bicuspidata NRRL YB-4993 TaxID=869754 RepID=A0A1A0HEC7_9ASCO|nr:hypothetical protein METBIDRAFT_86941 [Metschnikowia bicuspidata var. bicuspidata NRRL YB-4993]OBA22340.1 hypothetical protein METBIDRAFT_86941 [Metschnikowia bicuspidata var. bicuspidata NRRL YB-4993]
MSLLAHRSQVLVSHPRDLSDTPLTRVSGRISTPPHSIAGKRTHADLATPVRACDAPAKAVLLSPAFSSPQPPEQPVFDKADMMHAASRSFSDAISEPFSESLSETFSDGHVAEPVPVSQDASGHKRKKPKKVRREPRDACFSLASSEKPPYSYATLIGMAILSHPAKQLTLSQIYLWISETFKYYRREDVGWQNLIRHNLSLNKAFVKGEKSKDGKGHFWCIESNSEDLFLKAKNNKKSLYHEVMDQLALVNRQPHALIPLSPPSLADDDTQNPRSIGATHDDVDGDESNRFPSATMPCLSTPGRAEGASDLSEHSLLVGRSLGFTLSFSCSLNFELLPLPTLRTGPLLEPLSPGGNALLAQNLGHLLVHLPNISVSKSGAHLTQLQPPMTGTSTPRAAGTARTTPKSNMKTPLRLLRTPMSGSMIHKLGYSPSYLEEFNHSPFAAGRTMLNSYDDDDMLMRAFDSPAASKSSKPSLLGELTKATSEDVNTTDASQSKR